MFVRQGDVVLVRARRPAKYTEVPRHERGVVLAEGEVTGHAHVITAPGAKLVQAGQVRYLIADTEAVLAHEEHAPILVPAGTWEVRILRVYTPREPMPVLD